MSMHVQCNVSGSPLPLQQRRQCKCHRPIFFYCFPESAWGRYAHADSARTEEATQALPFTVTSCAKGRPEDVLHKHTHILIAMASRAVASVALVPTGPSMLRTIQSFDDRTCTRKARRLRQNDNSWVVPYSDGKCRCTAAVLKLQRPYPSGLGHSTRCTLNCIS